MQVERVATDIFDDEFSACMNRTVDELEEDLKYYTVLVIILGEICQNPVTKRNARAFLQWSKDILRLIDDPVQVQFTNLDSTGFIQHQNTNASCISKYKRVSETSTPA